MRQMLPVTRRSRAGRATARATVQGDELGIKDSGKGAGNVPVSEKGRAGEGPPGNLVSAPWALAGGSRG